MQSIVLVVALVGYSLAQDDKAAVAPVVGAAYNPSLFPGTGYYPGQAAFGQQRYFPGSPYYNPAVAAPYNPAVATPYNPYFPGAGAVPTPRNPAAIAALPIVGQAGVTARPYTGPIVPGAGAAIISKVEEVNPDGSFNYAYETENGIVAQGSGLLKNAGVEGQEAQVMQGSFSYTSPEGIPITVTWYADETGFHAEGQHLPRQPAVPTGEIPASAAPASRPN